MRQQGGERAAGAAACRGGARWRAIFAVIALGGALALLFLIWPELDLLVSRLAYMADGGFLLDRPWVRWVTPVGLQWLVGGTMTLIAVGLLATALGRPPAPQLRSRHYLFLLLSFAVGPGLVANLVLKEHWDRARPDRVVAFGGELMFTPPLQIADQCDSNCSFVSGDAAAAFTSLAFARLARRRRALWAGVAVAFGGAVGTLRILQGQHFLSDVLFAGVISAAIVLALEQAILRRNGAARQRRSATPPSGTT